MKRAATALVLALMGAGALAGCSKATIQPGTAQLAFSRARVQVANEGGAFRAAGAGSRLRTGDRVRVVAGDAQLHLARGATLLLRKGSQVVVGREPQLRAGDVVADVADEPVTLRANDSRVTVLSGASRVSNGLALTAGVYSGRARVTSAARSVTVPAYRQVSIAAFGVVPSTPSPLQYKVTDSWDLHYLGTAIEIGDELQRRSDGFSAQLQPTEGHTPGFFSLLLPGLDSRSLAACPTALAGLTGDGRPPGEVLVGTSLSLQAGGSFDARCRGAFAFRDAGAAWGLVALDIGVRSLPAIRERVVTAIGRLPAHATIAALGAPTTPVTPTAPGQPTVPTASSPPAGAPPSEPSLSPTPPPSSGTPVPTPTPAPVVPVPALPPDAGLLTPVTDLVDNVLSGLLG
ncbi:MAG: hypothetical protein QOE35_2227 [Actinomycetota bacterium]|jgi:hypothetical protein